MILTTRFAIAVALATVAVGLVVRSWWDFLGVNLALLVVAGVDAALAGSTRGLDVRRDGSSSTRLGELTSTSVVVRNRGRRAVHGVLRDAWSPSAGVVASRSRIAVAPERVTRVATSLVPVRRGVRRADRVTIRSIGPLGLAGRQSGYDAPWSVRVLPAFPSRRLLPSRLARLRELDGRTALLVRGEGSEFDSLRQYVGGDDVRSIDWRGTARSGDVMVRLWRPERDRRVVIVLDTGRTSAARVGIGTRLDTAIDAALLLAALASRAGDRVDLIAYDRLVRAEVRANTDADLVAQLSTALIDVEPVLVETDARGLVGAVLSRVRQRALVVVVGTLATSALREGLVPALPALCARHLVLFAAARDPDVEAMAVGRGDVDAAYRAAAAGAALDERRHSAALLRRLGVEVVDAGPDRLAADLADRYLALKTAGRL